MKRIYFSLIMVIIPFISLWAQKEYETQYEVQYQVEYSMDTLHLDNKSKEIVYLYTGSNYGVFMNYNEAHREEQAKDIEKQIRAGNRIEIKKRSSNFNKVFYKDLSSRKVYTVADISTKNFGFSEPKAPIEWQIKDSTKQVLDYSVQKATTRFAGRDYVAWFAVEIPIHDGPYLFGGLPGLIVELYDTRKEYVFELQSIQKLETPKAWKLPSVKEVSKTEYQKLKHKADKNKGGSVDQLLDNSINTENASSVEIRDANGRKISKAELRHMLKKSRGAKNNPIELE